MAHAETIQAACLAAAELFLNDEKGQYWQTFMERLAASVAHDAEAGAADSLGVDRQNESPSGGGEVVAGWTGDVTYKGYDIL